MLTTSETTRRLSSMGHETLLTLLRRTDRMSFPGFGTLTNRSSMIRSKGIYWSISSSSSGAASFNLDIQDVDYVAQVGGNLGDEVGSYSERTSIIEQFVFVDEDQLCIPLLGNSLPLSGDLDLDGQVAFSDFLILSSNFGEAGGYVDGDINCSGAVDFADFLALSANFGANAGASAVPEPSGIVLTMFGIIATLAIRRRGLLTDGARYS